MLLLGLGFVSFVGLQLGLAGGMELTPTSSTSSSAAATHTVSVGAEGHVFSPSSVLAAVGDVVEFRFYPLNHSVARAEFKKPCIPYEVSGVGKQGFWSGFRPLNVVASDPPSFSIKVNDTKSIFFYCSAPGACTDGMIGAINENSTQPLKVQDEFARNSTLAFSPGENFPAEVGPSSTAPSSGTLPTSGSQASASTSTPATAVPAHKSSLSGGAIAGITIGGVTVALLSGALIYMCARQRALKEMTQPQPIQTTLTSPFIGHSPMTSASAYSQNGFGSFDIHRFSKQRESLGHYGHARVGSEPSNSPRIEGGLILHPELGNSSPPLGNTPPIRRSMPARTYGAPSLPPRPADSAASHVRTGVPPTGPMPQRFKSQNGPHELPVDNGNDGAPYPF